VIAAALAGILWIGPGAPMAAAGRVAASAAGSPAESPSGVIRGRVVDETPPTHPLAGHVVRLQIVERGSSSERTTRTGAGGAFEFGRLPVGGLRVFVLSTEYQGASYEGPPRLVLTAEAPARDVPLAVYDAAPDRRALRGALLFAVVDVVPGALRVTTVEQMLNTGDRTIVPTATDPLVVPLPRTAVDVEPLDGWRDPRVEDGRLTDTRPIAPGAAQWTYAYQERPAGGAVPLVWAAPFGAARVEILVADAHVGVSAKDLRDAGVVTASGRRYVHWSGGPVAPGGSLSVELSGLRPGQDRWPGAAAGALAVLLAAGLAVSLRRGDARTGAGDLRGGVEAKFPAHISPRALSRAAVRRSAHSGTEETEAACSPPHGDGAPLQRSPS
jgi:hypothetical protein